MRYHKLDAQLLNSTIALEPIINRNPTPMKFTFIHDKIKVDAPVHSKKEFIAHLDRIQIVEDIVVLYMCG